MQIGWCLICGSNKREELAWTGPDPAIGRLIGQPAAAVRFVVCVRCGHVYQDPMLDQREIERLNVGEGVAASLSMADATPPALSADQSQQDYRLSQWLVELIEPTVRRMTVLATEGFACGRFIKSCHADACLFPFKERDWQVYEEGDADQRFSLILFPHAIERILDPIPMLRAMRNSLDEDGVLFVAAHNLLDPPPPTQLFGEIFSGSHVRLYSPGALQTLLARSGFQTDVVRSYQGDSVMGMVARPAEWVPDHPHDDAVAIQQLFQVLRWPGSTDVLGWNLAALAETQPWALPPLCRAMDGERYAIRRSGRCPLALEVHTSDGLSIPIVRWGDLDGYKDMPELLPPQSAPSQGHALTASNETLVQLGLGSGELAARLAEGLCDSQHLFIWEADPVLARRLLEVVDLSPLWLSTQVSLLLGDVPAAPPERQRRLKGPTSLHSTDSARCWNTSVYRQILGQMNLSGAAHNEA